VEKIFPGRLEVGNCE